MFKPIFLNLSLLMRNLPRFWTLPWWHLINFYYFLTGNLYISSSETTGVMLVLKKIGASRKHSGESLTSWKGRASCSASSCWILLSFSSKTSSSWVIFSVWRETWVDNSIIRLNFRSPSSTVRRLPQDSSGELLSKANKKRKIWAVLIEFLRTQRERSRKASFLTFLKENTDVASSGQIYWEWNLNPVKGDSGCSWKKNLEASGEGRKSVFANSFLYIFNFQLNHGNGLSLKTQPTNNSHPKFHVIFFP